MQAAKIAVTIPEDHRLTIIVLVGAAQADAPAAGGRRRRSPIGWLADEPEPADAILRMRS